MLELINITKKIAKYVAIVAVVFTVFAPQSFASQDVNKLDNSSLSLSMMLKKKMGKKWDSEPRRGLNKTYNVEKKVIASKKERYWIKL